MSSDTVVLLTREELLAPTPPKTAYCMFRGGRLKCRAMSSRERDAFDSATLKIEKVTGDRLDNFTMRVIASGVCEEDGTLMLTPKDVAAMGDQDSREFKRLYRCCADLNGFGDDEEVTTGKNP